MRRSIRKARNSDYPNICVLYRSKIFFAISGYRPYVLFTLKIILKFRQQIHQPGRKSGIFRGQTCALLLKHKNQTERARDAHRRRNGDRRDAYPEPRCNSRVLEADGFLSTFRCSQLVGLRFKFSSHSQLQPISFIEYKPIEYSNQNKKLAHRTSRSVLVRIRNRLQKKLSESLIMCIFLLKISISI